MNLQVVIAEDEPHARENLEYLLRDLLPGVQITGRFDTVTKTVEFLRRHQPDLLLLDIHLADDLSFHIFDHLRVDTPVIFTTAYDQYALRAFKVNSIDYLLKPIDREELRRALDKYQSLRRAAQIDYAQLQQMLAAPAPAYQQRFLVKRGDKILSVKVDDIAYFEGEDRYVFLTRPDGSRFIVDYKLSDLENLLDPQYFFRLNRSFIARIESISRITAMSKSRVKVDLAPPARRDIVVSSENTRLFKEWLNR